MRRRPQQLDDRVLASRDQVIPDLKTVTPLRGHRTRYPMTIRRTESQSDRAPRVTVGRILLPAVWRRLPVLAAIPFFQQERRKRFLLEVEGPPHGIRSGVAGS